MGKGWVGRGMGWEMRDGLERDGLGEGWFGRGMEWEKDDWENEQIILLLQIVILSLHIHLHRTANSGTLQVQV